MQNIRVAISEYLGAIPEVEKQFGAKISHEEVLV